MEGPAEHQGDVGNAGLLDRRRADRDLSREHPTRGLRGSKTPERSGEARLVEVARPRARTRLPDLAEDDGEVDRRRGLAFSREGRGDQRSDFTPPARESSNAAGMRGTPRPRSSARLEWGSSSIPRRRFRFVRRPSSRRLRCRIRGPAPRSRARDDAEWRELDVPLDLLRVRRCDRGTTGRTRARAEAAPRNRPSMVLLDTTGGSGRRERERDRRRGCSRSARRCSREPTFVSACRFRGCRAASSSCRSRP